MLYLITIFQVMLNLIEIIEYEDRQALERLNQLQRNALSVIGIINVLEMIFEFAIDILDNEMDIKLHSLFKFLRRYRYHYFVSFFR